MACEDVKLSEENGKLFPKLRDLQDSVLSRIHSHTEGVQTILSEGKNHIRVILRDAARDPQGQPYEEVFPRVLSCMGLTLAYSAIWWLQKAMGEEDQSGDKPEFLSGIEPGDITKFNFYFWPGYDSISSKNVERILIKDGEIDTGIGFTFHWNDSEKTFCLTEEYLDNASRRFYNFVLTFNGAPDTNSDGFISGSTHRWSVAAKDPPDIGDEGYLRILHIYLPDDQNGHEVSTLNNLVSPGDDHHQLHVALSPDRHEQWGREIARSLTGLAPRLAEDGEVELDMCYEERKINYELVWPLPLTGTLDQAVLDSKEKKIDWTIRLDLYSIWLTACFDYSAIRCKEVFSRLLDVLDNNRRELSDYLRRNYDVLISNLPTHDFKHWYTILLDKLFELPSIEDSEDLGSAMILSSHQLASKYFRIVRPWIESIYIMMRYLESTRKAERGGKLSQAEMFAHETVGLISTPWRDDKRGELSVRSQYSLWMARELVYLWGSAPMDTTSLVNEGDTAELPEWSGKSGDFIVEEIIKFALLHGLQRAKKSPVRQEDKALESILVETHKWAIGLGLKQDDRVFSEMKKRLNFLIEGEIPSWLVRKDFILAFYNAVWQATHHALVASFDPTSGFSNQKSNDTFLRIVFDIHQCTVYNRSYRSKHSSLRRMVEKRHLNPSTKDREFFDFLQERFSHSLTIDGPMPDPDPTCETQWLTRIRMQLNER